MSSDAPPAPVTNNYSDTMEDSLAAQIKLAPDLFKAESNQQYGRPAYARLMQDLTKESLFGNEIRYDEEGRQVTGYMDAKESFSISDNLAEVNAKKQEAAKSFRVPVMGGGAGFLGNGLFSNSMRKATGASDSTIAIPKEKFTVTGPDGKEKVFSTANEAENWISDQQGKAIYKKDSLGNVIYNKDKAGTVEGGTGAIALVGGNQFSKFSDGEFRKAGFDSEGNFLGAAQLEQDILERIKNQNAKTEVGLVEQYGGQLTDAYRAQGGIQEALDGYNARIEEGTDYGGLRTQLLNMAQEELALGDKLSDRETRNIQQASRSASTARGRGRDFSAVFEEVANNDMLSRQRLNERKQFASQAIGLSDQGRQMEQAWAAQRIGLEQATSADPFLALTGRASGASVGAGQNLYGNAAAGIGAGPTLFNPAQGAEFMANQSAMLNNYNASIYGAQQARSGAIIGGALGAIGSIGGGIAQGMGTAAACWVAREVYGVHNPAWLAFRQWMLFLSPFWFRAIYLNFGERFAKFIKDKPRLKARIRAWMDTKIRETV